MHSMQVDHPQILCHPQMVLHLVLLKQVMLCMMHCILEAVPANLHAIIVIKVDAYKVCT